VTDQIPAAARKAGRDAADLVLPDLISELAGSHQLRTALRLAADEGIEAAAPVIAAQAAAAERGKILSDCDPADDPAASVYRLGIRQLANPGTLRLLAAQLAFDDKPDESSNMYALADLLDGRP
jgi:hypothetical protein